MVETEFTFEKVKKYRSDNFKLLATLPPYCGAHIERCKDGGEPFLVVSVADKITEQEAEGVRRDGVLIVFKDIRIQVK